MTSVNAYILHALLMPQKYARIEFFLSLPLSVSAFERSEAYWQHIHIFKYLVTDVQGIFFFFFQNEKRLSIQSLQRNWIIVCTYVMRAAANRRFRLSFSFFFHALFAISISFDTNVFHRHTQVQRHTRCSLNAHCFNIFMQIFEQSERCFAMRFGFLITHWMRAELK